jgi:hypothetical protein
MGLRVVRRLARPPQASVEGLTGFLRVVVTVGFEQVPSAIGEDDRAFAWAERDGSDQSLLAKMAETPSDVLRAVAQIVQVLLADNPKRADRSQQSALDPVDLVRAFALPNQLALRTARQVQILGEHVTGSVFPFPITFAWTRVTPATAIPRIVAIP